MNSGPHILIVDDHREIRDLVSRALSQGRLPHQHRRRRQSHAQGAGRCAHRPHPARLDVAGRGRAIAVPLAARRFRYSDHHAHRQGRRGRSGDRVGNGRRRLSAEAIRQPRADRPHSCSASAQSRARRAGQSGQVQALPLRPLEVRCRPRRIAWATTRSPCR